MSTVTRDDSAVGEDRPRPSTPITERRASHVRGPVIIVAISVVFCMLAALGYSIAKPARYQATADILVHPIETSSNLQILPIVFESVEPGRSVETAVGLLDTDSAAAATARELGGSWTPTEIAAAVTVQPRGQSYLVEIVGTAASRDEANRLVDRFAQNALTLQDAVVTESAQQQITALRAQLNDPNTPPADQIQALILEFDAVARNGDPTLGLTQQSQIPMRAGLPRLTLVILGAFFGLLLGGVLAYTWTVRTGRYPSVGQHRPVQETGLP